MKRFVFITVIYSLVISTTFSQDNTEGIKNILSKYLENSANGRYLGWNGNRNDSLWLNPTDYEEKVKSFGKEFHLMQSDDCYIALSYSIDSINEFKDHALGFVTLDVVTDGYCTNLFKIHHRDVAKTYLLIKKGKRWYELSETNYWFISVKTYIKWAEDVLKNRSWEKDDENKTNIMTNLRNLNTLLRGTKSTNL